MATFGQALRERMEARGVSLRALARAVHYDVGYLSKVANDLKPPSVRLAECLDNFLEAGGALTALIPRGRGEEVGPTKRRDALKLGLVATLAPEALQRVLEDAAVEAMEFTRRIGVSAVGRGTFEHLEAVVTGLDRAYNGQPPAEVFSLARVYRRRVAELIQGAHTLREGRELFVFAAWLSELLAWLTHDMGSPLAAHAWAVDAYEHAEQAGHDELCAWATDAMASIAIYGGQHARALGAARRGMGKLAERHPLAVRLRAQAARAHAGLGQREECTALLRDAAELYERLPSRAPLRLAVDTGPLASYAVTSHTASAYLWLGDAGRGDFVNARSAAEAAIRVHESLPPSAGSPSREAIARIYLAIATAEVGAPEEAAALGRQALTTSRLVDSVLVRAEELNRVLQARYPGLGVAHDFQEVYLTSRTP